MCGPIQLTHWHFLQTEMRSCIKHFLNMGQNFTPNSNLFSCSALAQNYRFRWCEIWYDLSISFPILHAPNGNKGNDNQSETKTEFDTWNILAFQFTTGKQTKSQHIFYRKDNTQFSLVFIYICTKKIYNFSVVYHFVTEYNVEISFKREKTTKTDFHFKDHPYKNQHIFDW